MMELGHFEPNNHRGAKDRFGSEPAVLRGTSPRRTGSPVARHPTGQNLCAKPLARLAGSGGKQAWRANYDVAAMHLC
jgi:hypothetical protein